MNDIDIEEYNDNIIQELNAAEDEGECSLSIFLHDLIEIDIESNFTFNYKVVERIIDICINALNSHMTLLAHECMYFVRYCINKCINIKENVNENFFKNLNIIINICLNECNYSDDSFLLFERTFFFFVLDLNIVTNLIQIWKNYSIELISFSKSLFHIILFHLNLLKDILNKLKTEGNDINYIQKGHSRIKIIEIASDLLLHIFQNSEEIQNISNFENYIDIILKEYENVPDIEIKKKIISLLKSIHKFITEKKIDNFPFSSQISNLINKKRNYYLTLTKEKDINIDYLKGNSYIYINNSILFVKTYSDVEENCSNDEIFLTYNGYKGSLLMNIFYTYFYNRKNKLLMVLSYDRIKIKNDEDSKKIIFYFKKNDAIGILSNKLRKNFEDRFLDKVEISISFSTESIKKKVYNVINCVVEIENISDDDKEKTKDEEGKNLKDNLYINKLKNDINHDSSNDLIKNDNDKNKEKIEIRKVSFATTKEICLLNDNISVETKTMLLEESLNHLDCNNNNFIYNKNNLEVNKLANNDIADALFNESLNLNENISSTKGDELEKIEPNLKISYATTKDLLLDNSIYDNSSKSDNHIYEISLNESPSMNSNKLNNTFNENQDGNLLQINLLEEKINKQDNKLNNYIPNENMIKSENNYNDMKKHNPKNKNIESNIDIIDNNTSENKLCQNKDEMSKKYETNEKEICENEKKNIQGYEEKINIKNNDNKDMLKIEDSDHMQSKEDTLNFKNDINKNVNEKKEMLKNLIIENNKQKPLKISNVNGLKLSVEYETNNLNNSKNLHLRKEERIPKSPIDIVKELLNYDEKQKNIDECMQSLSKYDSGNKLKINKYIKDKKNIIIAEEDRKFNEKNENLSSMQRQRSESNHEQTNVREKEDELKNVNILSKEKNENIYKKELLEKVSVHKSNRRENMGKCDNKKNNDLNITKEYSEIVNILGNDEPSNEIILNSEKDEINLKESTIDKSCLINKNKKRISTNTFNDNNDYYLKNNIASPYPIKKVKFNNYDSSFLDLLKKEDNLENLSAKYLIKAYTLIQYNKRNIHIQIIDYFRYIRNEILISYEKINIKYSNLLNELQLKYEIKFQNIISKYSNRLTQKKKNINLNMPQTIDLNLIKEKKNSLYDTFNIVQRTIKNKISNSKILMKYKQSDIYTPSFSLATIISKYST